VSTQRVVASCPRMRPGNGLRYILRIALTLLHSIRQALLLIALIVFYIVTPAFAFKREKPKPAPAPEGKDIKASTAGNANPQIASAYKAYDRCVEEANSKASKLELGGKAACRKADSDKALKGVTAGKVVGIRVTCVEKAIADAFKSEVLDVDKCEVALYKAIGVPPPAPEPVQNEDGDSVSAKSEPG